MDEVLNPPTGTKPAQTNEKGLAYDSQPPENLVELTGIKPLTARLPVGLADFNSSPDYCQLIIILMIIFLYFIDWN
jgi:hypothetical protein